MLQLCEEIWVLCRRLILVWSVQSSFACHMPEAGFTWYEEDGKKDDSRHNTVHQLLFLCLSPMKFRLISCHFDVVCLIVPNENSRSQIQNLDQNRTGS
ncbi:hypothetical protein H5410_046128 [Solanum commersonii]|uniref:Secreted protein n=1 Tax=Solanum commersonii TaxID=4109 RepID=A0A9J5XES0_SOLCO|nr:hypothetical protein H5410_046128 [Solanum commersonii]